MEAMHASTLHTEAFTVSMENSTASVESLPFPWKLPRKLGNFNVNVRRLARNTKPVHQTLQTIKCVKDTTYLLKSEQNTNHQERGIYVRITNKQLRFPIRST